MIQQKLKILLVEDNESDKILIERQIKKIVDCPVILHVMEFEVVKASVELFKPDIILCDYKLNGFSGLDVLNFVRISFKHIPVIFVTGTVNDEELAASTILSGASGYILKKNIDLLHKKLLPYFNKIVGGQEIEPITGEHKKVLTEMDLYLKSVRIDNEMIKANFIEMKNALEKIKLLDK